MLLAATLLMGLLTTPTTPHPVSAGMMAMPLVASYVHQEPGISNSMVIVNSATNPSPITVVLRRLNGQTVTTRSLVVPARDRLDVTLASLLPESERTEEFNGSLTITPGPGVHGLGAVLMITDQTRGGNPSFVDEEFQMPSSDGSSTLRAVAQPGTGVVRVGVTSLGMSLQHLSVRCVGSEGKPKEQALDLKPGETRTVLACGGEGNPRGAVGIELHSDGGAGEIAAFGMAERKDSERRDGGHRWDAVTFDDPGMRQSGQTAFVGIPFGAASFSPDADLVPRLSIANFASTPVTLTVHSYLSNQAMDKTTPLPDRTLILGPNEARDVSLEIRIPGDAESPSSADGINVLSAVLTGGAPGQAAAKMYSLDRNGSGEEVELLGRDVKAHENGGGHPFSLADNRESSVFLMNTTDARQVFNLRISNQSGIWQKAYTLAPHASQAFSIRAMIASQEKDDAGRILPATMTSGEVSWFTPGPGRGAGRLMISDASTGMARNFSCWNQVVVCQIDPFDLLQFGLATVSPGVTAQAETCLADYGYCDGQLWGPGGSGFSYQWSTLDTSIAPLNSDPTQPSVDFWGAATGGARFDVGVEDGYGCSASGGGSDTVVGVTQSPSTLNLSSGDTNKSIAVSISPAGATANVSFNVAFVDNPHSASQATVSIGPQSGVSGTQNIPISVSGSNSPSGIFTATAQVYGSQAPQSTKLTIPPQGLIQVLYGEAHGQYAIGDNVSEPAVGSSIRNRFGHSEFPGGDTSDWQDVIVASQYAGINTGITTGTTPELDLAVALFAGTQADSVAGSTCFFSPTAADWTAVQQALNSGATAVPVMDRDPKCYSTSTPGEQIVYKSSIGNNASGSGAPAFLFERQKSQDTDHAVVEIP